MGGDGNVQRDAESAARRVAAASGLDLDDPPELLPGIANTVLHFASAGVVAKVAVRDRFRDAVHREHAIASELAAAGAAAPRPLAGTVPQVDGPTGFVVTLWHFIPHDPTLAPSDDDCVSSLAVLHHALDRTTTPLPPFTDELRSARTAVDDDDFMADVSAADRDLLARAFDTGLTAVDGAARGAHRLHGEPHAANRLLTSTGVVWVDLESCCIGPREWDLAFLAADAVDRHPGLDPELLGWMRLLNAARFATWQSGLMRRSPELRPHAAENLAFVRGALG